MQDRFRKRKRGARRPVTVAAVAALCFAGLVFVVRAATLAEVRVEFDRAIQRLDGSREEQDAVFIAQYIKGLREIQSALETQGQIRGVVAVFDELSRCTKAKSLPKAPAAEPVELYDLQIRFMSQLEQQQYSNELEVVRLAGRYVQALAQGAATSSGQATTAEVIAERERILTLPRLRAALKATAGPPPDIKAVFASVTNVDLRFRSLKLTSSDTEALSMRMAYDLQVSLAEDDSKLRVSKSTSSLSTSQSESGYVGYRPRFIVTARSDTLPPGCRVVATYYSRSLTDRTRKLEDIETIDLPAIEKGQSYALNGRGITLTRSYSTTSSTRGYNTVSVHGQEWYGLVVQLQTADGAILLHRSNPQTLEREVERDGGKTLPR